MVVAIRLMARVPTPRDRAVALATTPPGTAMVPMEFHALTQTNARSTTVVARKCVTTPRDRFHVLAVVAIHWTETTLTAMISTSVRPRGVVALTMAIVKTPRDRSRVGRVIVGLLLKDPLAQTSTSVPLTTAVVIRMLFVPISRVVAHVRALWVSLI